MCIDADDKSAKLHFDLQRGVVRFPELTSSWQNDEIVIRHAGSGWQVFKHNGAVHTPGVFGSLEQAKVEYFRHQPKRMP